MSNSDDDEDVVFVSCEMRHGTRNIKNSRNDYRNHDNSIKAATCTRRIASIKPSRASNICRFVAQSKSTRTIHRKDQTNEIIVLDGDTSSSDDEIEVLLPTHSKSGCSARLEKREAEQTTLKKRDFKLYSQNYVSKERINDFNFKSHRSRSTNSTTTISPSLGATNYSIRRKRRRVAAQDLVSSDYAYALAISERGGQSPSEVRRQ